MRLVGHHLSSRTLRVLVLALALAGCEEDIQVGRGVTPEAGGATATPTPPPDVAPTTPAAAPDAGLGLSYRDDDFVEAETNRDPFRSFAEIFVTRPTREPVQREVVMPRTAIDDMRLIAIVSGMANPSAMLVDTDGTGHTVHRGDYLGRPEVVQTGGEDAVPITLNWRVDRIRPGEVVLTREDPTAPNRPPLTRVIPLHTETTEATL
ncbi:pilus assembly protein PilP [Sandaracinus amylolyticus]|uniref:pilus assembly protein PilP n=1 Tax=Sandaracinus amylolyticus TaxID=927083 RepID=UPI001F1C03D7|nr:pilus assembly protein PilP [Sandaracinus amylolyticus]UJR79048.1 Type IV pilus biogenesis protein PilP [Sandaracinus amylolyticus]